MQISEVMTRDVEIARPDDTIRTAAKMMADLGVGVLPVGEGDHLAGMITDRDVTVRAVACGLDPDRATLREVMTAEVRYCFEDEAIEEAARRMGEAGVRRLPVLNRAKRLVGIVSLGDVSIADRSGAGGAAGALRNVSRAPADERQGALALAGGKPRATMPEGDARGGSGIDPDDLMKGGF